MDGWLPTTAYALLGLMSFDEEFTGYQLQRRAAASLSHFFWRPAMSQIYTELRRLEGLGLVAQRGDPQPAKRVYRITEQGRRALASWVADGPHDPPSLLKHLTCLRTFYGHLVAPERLREKVEHHRRWSEARRQELGTTLEDVRALERRDRRWRYAAFVIEWGLDYYDTESRAAARLVERLDALAAEGAAEPPTASP